MKKEGNFFLRKDFAMAATHQYHPITIPETVSKGGFVAFVANSTLLVYMTTKLARKVEQLMAMTDKCMFLSCQVRVSQ